jgi:hypothetical protein
MNAPHSRRIGPGVALAILIQVYLTGCGNLFGPSEVLYYRTDGSYTALRTDGNGAAASKTLTLSKAGAPTADRGSIRMCDITNVAWHLGGLPDSLGRPVTIVTELASPLCQVGNAPLAAGYMIVWGASSVGTTGVRSNDWTVTGTVTISEYVDLKPPEPALDQELLSERISGTFSLVATAADGRSIRLESGTFTFSLYTKKGIYSPLS